MEKDKKKKQRKRRNWQDVRKMKKECLSGKEGLKEGWKQEKKEGRKEVKKEGRLKRKKGRNEREGRKKEMELKK